MNWWLMGSCIVVGLALGACLGLLADRTIGRQK